MVIEEKSKVVESTNSIENYRVFISYPEFKIPHDDLKEINIKYKSRATEFYNAQIGQIETKTETNNLPDNYKTSISDLSKITIGKDGVSNSNYQLEHEFFCRIIDINNSKVIVECIIENDPKVIETRAFDLGLFTGFEGLYAGKLFILHFLRGKNEEVLRVIEKTGDRFESSNFETGKYLEILNEIDLDLINGQK
jgi:hypothetical protein